MVQNKLPLINSAHGSETRNIINELIKLFNGMGYTYNEALSKAHDVLNEAKKTNDMNKDVQTQINNLILSDGESDAEVIQARGTHALLNDRLNELNTFVGDASILGNNYRSISESLKDRGVNVKDFGAVGDGVADDTNSLINALEYGKENGLMKVFIPSGTYLIQPNKIILPESMTLQGNTYRDSIIRSKDLKVGTGVKLLSGSTIDNIYIRDFETGIDNTSFWTKIYDCKLSYNNVGIKFNKDSYIVKCLRNEISFNGVGVMIGSQTYELIIKDNIIDNNDIGVVSHSSSKGFILNDNTIEGNRNKDTNVGCGVLLTGMNYSRTSIQGNWFEANGSQSDKSVDVLLSPYKPGNTDPYAMDIYNTVINDCIPPEYHDLVKDKYLAVGMLNLNGNAHTLTKHGVIVGYVERLNINIENSSFTGTKDKYNIPVYLGSLGGSKNTVTINNNNPYSSAGVSIDDQLLRGIKGSYVYSNDDINTVNNKFMLDNENLFGNVVIDFEDLGEYGTVYELDTVLTTETGEIKTTGLLDNKYIGKSLSGEGSAKLVLKDTQDDVFTVLNNTDYYILIGDKHSKFNIQYEKSWITNEVKKHKIFDIRKYNDSLGGLPVTDMIYSRGENSTFYLLVKITEAQYNDNFKNVSEVQIENTSIQKLNLI